MNAGRIEAVPWVASLFACPRLNRLIGSGGARKPAAMGGREVVFRARFAGEKQPVVDRSGKYRAAIRHAGQSVGIRAAREGVDAPGMDADRFDAAREIIAKKAGQFGHRGIEEGGFARCFQRRGVAGVGQLLKVGSYGAVTGCEKIASYEHG